MKNLIKKMAITFTIISALGTEVLAETINCEKYGEEITFTWNDKTWNMVGKSSNGRIKDMKADFEARSKIEKIENLKFFTLKDSGYTKFGISATISQTGEKRSNIVYETSNGVVYAYMPERSSFCESK